MLEIRQGLEGMLTKAVEYGVEDIETPQVTLEETFLALYDRTNNGGNDA